MRKDSTRKKRYGLLYPWLLLFPVPLYVVSMVLGNTPNNVLYQRGLQEAAFLLPGISASLGIVLSVFGVAVLISENAMPKWRKTATLILSAIHFSNGLLYWVLIVWVLIRLFFFGISV